MHAHSPSSILHALPCMCLHVVLCILVWEMEKKARLHTVLWWTKMRV